MTIVQTTELTPRKSLRLWPGVVAVVLQWLLWLVVPVVAPDATLYAMFGALACAPVVVVWWLFFSRAPWLERVGFLVLMPVAVFATRPLVHASIENAYMGRMLFLYALPALSLAFVAATVISRRLPTGLRRASMAGGILLGCGVFTLLRTDGVMGAGSQLAWRWTPTSEERLLAHAADEPVVESPLSRPTEPPPAAAAAETPKEPLAAKTSDKALASARGGPLDSARGGPAALPSTAKAEPAIPTAVDETKAEWPGFRGPNRDGVVRGVQIDTDWSKSPPVELWRKPIGPGWSSFAVHGDLVYTQEQRGEDEDVSCYNLKNGKLVWRHKDTARFWESNGGAGPRGTPTLSNGRVYTLGATGIVNALNARDGSVVWSRNASSDTGAADPGWGFTSSPLVVNDLVIVAASGRLIAYEIATGQPRWRGPANGAGYSSPHLATIDGVPQVLLSRGARTTSVAPADGAQLWEHFWQPGVSIVQPAVISNGDVLVTSADAMGGNGIRRLALARGPAGWTIEERWTSKGLKPYFNDFVVHNEHAFGFDGNILACVDLADGTRKWKGGRYGNGQLVLLPDQDLLLVLSEEGELALVRAAADQFAELARFPALTSKSWSHPVLVGDVLLIRNGEEMAAFRLSVVRPLTHLSQ